MAIPSGVLVIGVCAVPTDQNSKNGVPRTCVREGGASSRWDGGSQTITERLNLRLDRQARGTAAPVRENSLRRARPSSQGEGTSPQPVAAPSRCLGARRARSAATASVQVARRPRVPQTRPPGPAKNQLQSRQFCATATLLPRRAADALHFSERPARGRPGKTGGHAEPNRGLVRVGDSCRGDQPQGG